MIAAMIDPTCYVVGEEPDKPTSGELPQFLKDMISAPPKSGDGIHSWLFKVSRQLHAHRDPESIFQLLSAQVEGCGRHVPEREIREAIASAENCAWQRKGGVPYQRPTPKWPEVNKDKQEEVLSKAPFGIADLWDTSPIQCDLSTTTDYFLNELFPGNPLLCLGSSSQSFETKPRDEFTAPGERYCLIVPSPMSAPTGKRKSDGKESAHTLDNTGPRRFLVTEFDSGTPDEQAAIIHALSKFAPLVMVMSSGGKSLHAWWRCWDADESTVDRFFRYAVSLGADPATWTRSQFVRLPQGWRADKNKPQEVIYFDQGLADESVSPIWRDVPLPDQLPPEPVEDVLEGVQSMAEILSTDTSDDPTALIGYKRRFLCEAGSFVLAAASGVGKSTLFTSFAIYAAAGQPWHGIEFRRPLRVLIVQAENDNGDMAEMSKGAFHASGLSMHHIKLAVSNIKVKRLNTLTGPAFCAWLEKVVVATHAELVLIDPLMSYIGDDISSQKVCSHFLRNCLQPVLDRTRAIAAIVHHGTKTPTDSKSRESWSESDFSYYGFGSSEITNWTRACAVFLQTSKDSGKYKFLLTKRGSRAGMVDAFTREFTKSITLEHSEKGMGWVQAAPDEESEDAQRKSGAKAKITPNDILKELSTDVATRRDVLTISLADKFSCSQKIVGQKIDMLIFEGKVFIQSTEKRPRGGHPIEYLAIKKNP